MDGCLSVCAKGHLADQRVGYCSARGLLLETVKAGALPAVEVLLLRNWELPGGGRPGLRFSCPLLPSLLLNFSGAGLFRVWCTNVGGIFA